MILYKNASKFKHFSNKLSFTMTSLEELLFFLSTFSLATLIYFLFFNLCTRRFNCHPHPLPLPLPPGPKPWPIIGNLPHLGPMPHHSLASMVSKYGPLIHLRLGSVHLVIAGSSSVASQCLRTHDANFSNRPLNFAAKYIGYNDHDLAFAPYGSRWRMLRKICTLHLFSRQALDDYRDVRQEEVALLTSALIASSGTRNSVPVHLGQLLSVCTANILGRALLGKRISEGNDGCFVDSKSLEFKEMVVESMALAGLFNIGDFVPWLAWLHLLPQQGVIPKMKKLNQRFDAFFNTIIEERKMNGCNSNHGGTRKHTDLLSKLIELKNDVDGEGSMMTDTNMKALFLDLFGAGMDTSSNTMEWAMAELIRHPDILVQAQQELDSVVGKDRLVMESDLDQLPYLQAITKEVFRLHSSPLSLPRVAEESCEINGYYIPKNSTVIVNFWGIAHDPIVWPDPFQFKPERFLPGNDKAHIDIKGNDFEAIPFGAGRRICVAMSLGIRMVQLVIATLIHAFEWGLPECQVAENLNMEEAFGLSLQRASPLMVHPSPRLDSHVYCISKT